MSHTTHSPLLKAAESRLLNAAKPFIIDYGLNDVALRAAAVDCGLTEGELRLLCPNGASDLAAILWQAHDKILLTSDLIANLEDLKIRQKIDLLLNTRLDAAFEIEAVAKSLIGFLAMPHHLALGHRLMWQTADIVWRFAGDRALDENHYSKRVIVSGILSTAALSRLSRGREAQVEQIRRNIEQVMAFETFKARIPLTPEKALTEAFAIAGNLRFGRSPKATGVSND